MGKNWIEQDKMLTPLPVNGGDGLTVSADGSTIMTLVRNSIYRSTGRMCHDSKSRSAWTSTTAAVATRIACGSRRRRGDDADRPRSHGVVAPTRIVREPVGRDDAVATPRIVRRPADRDDGGSPPRPPKARPLDRAGPFT